MLHEMTNITSQRWIQEFFSTGRRGPQPNIWLNVAENIMNIKKMDRVVGIQNVTM